MILKFKQKLYYKIYYKIVSFSSKPISLKLFLRNLIIPDPPNITILKRYILQSFQCVFIDAYVRAILARIIFEFVNYLAHFSQFCDVIDVAVVNDPVVSLLFVFDYFYPRIAFSLFIFIQIIFNSLILMVNWLRNRMIRFFFFLRPFILGHYLTQNKKRNPN